MMTKPLAFSAVLASLCFAGSACAQVYLPWGGVHITTATPVRSVYTGGSVSRLGAVSSISPFSPFRTRRMVTRSSVWRSPVLVPSIVPSVHIPSVRIPSVHVTPQVHVHPRATSHHADLRGMWRVTAGHVDATMSLSTNSYGLVTPSHREVGVWSWSPSSGLGSSEFTLTLQSSNRSTTTFHGVWIVPGQKFQMTSLNSGLTYTVYRTTELTRVP